MSRLVAGLGVGHDLGSVRAEVAESGEVGRRCEGRGGGRS